jgi:hypothetical protein
MDLDLNAIEEIRQTKCRYFRFTDTKDWDGLAKVFSRDCVFGGSRTRGPEKIVEVIRNGTDGVKTVHHGHNSEVWIDSPDEARAITAFEDLGFAPSGELVMHGYGRYDELYRREDGAWRIADCRIERFAVVDNGPTAVRARQAAATS